jgi:hypothetical protein
VINVSVGYALGAWTGALARELYCPRSVSIVPGDGRRLSARRVPWVLSLPVWDSDTLPRGSDFK